jgi:multidrug transporter EmrE-like cation transporter
MMGTPVTSMILFALAAIFGAVGQYLYKSGADGATGSVWSYLLNPRLAGGVVCYVAVMVLFVAAFKRGGALATLYPIYATTFIWAALIAWAAFGTPIKPVNVAGMILLAAGMCLMGR